MKASGFHATFEATRLWQIQTYRQLFGEIRKPGFRCWYEALKTDGLTFDAHLEVAHCTFCLAEARDGFIYLADCFSWAAGACVLKSKPFPAEFKESSLSAHSSVNCTEHKTDF